LYTILQLIANNMSGCFFLKHPVYVQGHLCANLLLTAVFPIHNIHLLANQQ